MMGGFDCIPRSHNVTCHLSLLGMIQEYTEKEKKMEALFRTSLTNTLDKLKEKVRGHKARTKKGIYIVGSCSWSSFWWWLSPY